MTQGSFVFRFYHKELCFNTCEKLEVYKIVADFADFLDHTQKTYGDCKWFLGKILESYNPDYYNLERASCKLMIDVPNQFIMHDIDEKKLSEMVEKDREEFEESLNYLKQKKYSVINEIEKTFCEKFPEKYDLEQKIKENIFN